MELLHITLCAFLILTPTDQRVVTRTIPSFLRDDVERYPSGPELSDRSAAYTNRELYGTRALPLRSAVEHIPDLIADSRRLPLRDAVEKRPPPDEPIDDYEPSFDLFYYPSRQTLYTPVQYFKDLVAEAYVSPFRIDNESQELLKYPSFARGRSLYDSRGRHSEIVETVYDPREDDRVVCYVQAAARYRKEPLAFSPEDLDPFACTHVIYAFATIDPHNFNMISNDDESDIIQGGYISVTGLKRVNPKLKVLISVGEGRDGSHRFSTMVSSANRRREFIRSAITFIKQYNFDGMDIHWEYPGAEKMGGQLSDKEYLNLFLEELSEIFKPRGWVLTIAVPASRFRVEDGFNPQRLGSLVDFINLQAFDFHREREPVADHHANLYSRPGDSGLDLFLSVDYAVKFWTKKGFPKSKIVLGVPFFGRSFTLQFTNETQVGAPIKGPGREGFYTQNPGFLAYFEICDMLLNEGWHKGMDESGSPYMVYGDQWVGYDDSESVEKKVNYVQEMNLGGVFIWATDLDDFKGVCGMKWPLLSTINRHLRGNELLPMQQSQNPPTKPYGTCRSEGIFSDPKNCAAYYVCRSGLSYHLSCAENMMFDPMSGKCEYSLGEKCRPGQIIQVANSLRQYEDLLEYEAKEEGPKVVCYMTNWAFYRKAEGKFVPEHIDQRLCTHVVYAFASLDPEKLLLKEFDPWADLDNNLYERVTSLKDTKAILSLGGWTDSAGDKYSRLVGDGSARRRFVVAVVGFLRRHNFKGLHLDWNYPVCWQSNCKKGASSDKPNFTKLIQELRREFDKQKPPLILAAAISGYKEVIDVAYDLPALGTVLDFMSVMTYDYHGAWERQTGHVSPLFHRPGDKYPQYNTNFTMEYLVSRGAPRGKLLVGVPFYGQSFTLTKGNNHDQGVPSAGPGEAGEYTKQPGMLAYYEICNRIRNQRWIVNRDTSGATGPFAYHGDQWVGFEDIKSVRDKAEYIKTKGFGGAVAWTIDLDDFSNRCCGGSFPLLRSLNRGLGLIPDNPSREDCTKPPEPVTPAPPQVTTGVDTGASSTEHMHPDWTTKPSTWWSSTTTSPWWTTTTTRRTTTTRPTTTSTTTRPTTTNWPTQGTTIPPPAVVMPEVDKPSQPCEPGQYVPDPHNCNAYYRCVLGELRKQYCAGGLHWNKERKICDWPKSAKCEEKKPGHKPSTSSWQKPTKPSYRPPSTTNHWQTKTTTSTTTRPTTTVSQLIDDKCDSGQYYPHESCSSFYVCVNGHLVPQNCAPGLHYNPEEHMCDWKYKVKCVGRKQLAQKYQLPKMGGPQPYSACSENAFAAYPGDCTRYLHCLWGKYEVFNCAPGLHWDNNKNICDWPEKATCDGTSNVNVVDIVTTAKPAQSTTSVSTTTSWNPGSTTNYPEWQPTEWHPPIPPTSEKPPLPEELKPQSGYFKIVCYFTNWAWYRKGLGKYLPEDIDPDLCTHIVYGFAVLDFENLIVKAHDSWADFDNQFYKRVTGYKAKGIKVSLALGGWNDSQGDKYSRLVNNPAARARFIKHVLQFLEKWNFDGLDLDWEYPKCWQVDCKKGPDSDKQAFAAWVTELKQAFKPKGYLLSAAVSPSKTVIDAGYDVPVLAQNLDWVAVMTYDFHGQWDKQTGHVAPLYYHPEDEVVFYNANFSINYWISEGVPRRKIVMGMPLYGQSFRLEKPENHGLNAKAPGPGQAGEYTRAAGFLAYYEICHNIKTQGWTVVQDPNRRMGPYAYKGDQWVSFDDREMIKRKSEFIRKMDLGGGMIWALDLDDFKNRCGEGRHPLLTTIRNVLADAGTGQQETIPPIDEEPPSVEAVEEEREEAPPSVHSSTVVPPPQHSTTQSLVDPKSEFKVVCYFTNWAWYRQGVGKYLPSDIDPDLCTHIVYGFAVLNGDQLIIKPHDTWADFDNKFYEKVTAYKSKGIKVLVAIGGWNDSAGDKYSRLVNNPSARRRFIAHVVDFIETNNFDGLDLDWEYPKCWQVDCNKGPASDKSAFADFVKELHEAFKPKGWLLSAAVSPSRRVVDAGYDVPTLSKYLDWIAVMCYDYHGQWDKITGHVAPMYAHPEDADATFNTNFTIHYWIEKGADRRKLVMGMPMYGQSFSLADNNQNGLNAATYGGGEAGEETRARGFLAYYEICTNVIKKGWKVVRDRRGRIGPYAYLRDQWVSFDDIGMIRHKSEFIKAMGLGGGMIWALDLDDFKNLCGCEEYPLLRTINRVLRGYAKPDPKCILGRDNDKTKPKPTTMKPTTTIGYEPQEPVLPAEVVPCQGRLFVADDTNCAQYYLCNQGQLQLQVCPNGLFWNKDHCDWPENTECHPDASSTMAPSTTPMVPDKPVTTTTSRPIGTDTSDDYKVVCYFTNWAWYRQGDGKYLPSDIDPSLCTHINYGFAVLDSSSMTLKPHDSWADIDNEFYKKVVSYKSRGVKVLIALGGWNDSAGNKYSRLVNDPQARAAFIAHVLAFIEEWNFDGLDLDWEYPKCWQVDCNKGPDSDKEAFAAFVRELSAAFKPKNLLLSAAVSPSKAVIDAGYDVPALSQYLDWIAVMTYDFHGHWDKQTGHVAPLYYYPGDVYDYFNANFSLNYWIEKGADPGKIVMGMPLYGQSFSLADAADRGLNAKSYGPGEAGEFTRAGGFLAYYEICERVKKRGWTVTRDPQGRIGPYAYLSNQWVSYDDIAEIRRKSRLVKALKLGGGMVWALDLDDFKNRCGCGKHPLLKTLNNELRGTPSDISVTNCT
ncbi:chitinase 10 isoform X1 [Tribolium castaneum]|uniref:chitinase n=1 Tax=Tribolium castaneum TaxID=7070 RepID=D6WZW3_TRICA|nr:PREDICTED: chitinase 10 isoform X1 [Tribolium castaneum]EFA10488.1 putative chitinase 3-like Protein [Tribolium castaneum]|eukprot:XP_008198138.1 PREDICTED: chitinase 10 isoform X1 [Tribolium castaneum]